MIFRQEHQFVLPAMTRYPDPGLPDPDPAPMPETGDIASLVRLLGDPDPRRQWRAAVMLGSCGERAVPHLLGALRSGNDSLRLGAVEALGMTGDPRAIAPLAEISGTSRCVEIRWAAVLALGGTSSPAAVPYLVPLLRDPVRYIRYGAATALDQLRWQPESGSDTAYLLAARNDWDAVLRLGSGALPPLYDLLDDTDPASREKIISVIGRIGGSQALPACRKTLKDRDRHVRWTAVLASMNCGLASHDLPLMVAGRERTGPDPAAAALLNFLFLGIGYNYLGRWWGFPIFMTYMSVLVLAQLAIGPFLPYLIAYPVTAVIGIHTYYLAERMADEGM